MHVIILGATSAIAAATARLYAEAGWSILLVGRNERRLGETAADLKARGALKVEIALHDLAEAGDAPAKLQDWSRLIGGIDHVLIAYGLLGDQRQAEQQAPAAEEILRVNFTSPALWALAAANLLEERGQGSLIVLGSVAGDRGRRSNFVYGAAKAGIGTIMEGIAHRFAGKGPRAVLIKLGPTITPMTAHMKRAGPMWAEPQQVARIIHARAFAGPMIAYAPARWRYVMAVIRNMPSALFNKLDL